MDRLLKALERMTGRTLDPGPKRKLRQLGILSPDENTQDRVMPLEAPRPAPAPIQPPRPQTDENGAVIRRQKLISQLLRQRPPEENTG